jgi:uncharacterized membrane protein SpoIIM required for sporulation
VDDPRNVLLARRAEERRRLAELIGRAGTRPGRLASHELLEIGRIYRHVAADLAVLRRRFPGDPEILGHERLVTQAQSIVYAQPRRAFGPLAFFVRRYWQRVVQLRWHLATAAGLMVLSAVIAYLWARADPAAASRFFPIGGMRTSWEDQGMSVGEQTTVSAEIFVNNIRVSFLAFALGITFGIGTVIVLVFNGAMLGTLTGLAVGAGNGTTLFTLVVAHGVLELSVIAVAAAAGMAMGWSMLVPGNVSRSRSLARSGRHAVEVVVGTVPWFILAGLIEGFITPNGFGPAVAGVVGVAAGGLYWGLVAWRGRLRAGDVAAFDIGEHPAFASAAPGASAA